MRNITPIAAAGAALSLVSCQLLFPSIVNDDADGGAPLRDGSTTDGGDATTSTGDSAAGSSDVGTGEAAISFCEAGSKHTFCFDFDNVGNAASGWSPGSNVAGANEVDLDPMVFRSAPYSMKSSVDSDSLTATYAVLVQNVPLNSSQLVIAADVRPTLLQQDTDYNNAGLLGANFINDAGGYYSVSLGLSASGPSLGVTWPTDDAGDYTSMSEDFSTLNADDAGWTHIEATITFGPPLTIALTFNGHSEWNGPFTGTVAIDGLSGAGVFVGIVASGDAGPLAVNFDNVTIDVTTDE